MSDTQGGQDWWRASDWKWCGSMAMGLLAAVAVLSGKAISVLIVAMALLAAFFGVGQRRRLAASLRSMSGYSALIVLPGGLVLLNWMAPPGVTLPMRVLGSAIVACGILPLVIWHRYHELPIPLFQAICGLYVFYFGVPVFLTSQFSALSRYVPSNWIVPAQAVALSGLIAMETTYYLAVKSSRVRYIADTWQPTISDQPSPVWLILGFLGLFVYGASRLVDIPVAFDQVLVLVGALTVLAAVQLYIRHREDGLSPIITILWLVMIGGRIVLGFGTGANNEALTILVALGITVAVWRRRIPWFGVALAITAILVLQPVKLQFRKESSAYGGPILTGSAAYLRQAADYLRGGSGYEGVRTAYLERFGFLSTLAAVVQQSPQSVPYWHGATYEPVLTKLVPRVLLPGKPEEDTGQMFGHRYGLLNTRDTRTSYNMPMLVEFYANFGLIGAILGMAFLGWAYVSMQYVALRKLNPLLGTGSAIFVLSTLAYIESSFSFVFANAFYALVAVYAVCIGLQITQKRQTIPSARVTALRHTAV